MKKTNRLKEESKTDWELASSDADAVLWLAKLGASQKVIAKLTGQTPDQIAHRFQTGVAAALLADHIAVYDKMMERIAAGDSKLIAFYLERRLGWRLTEQPAAPIQSAPVAIDAAAPEVVAAAKRLDRAEWEAAYSAARSVSVSQVPPSVVPPSAPVVVPPPCASIAVGGGGVSDGRRQQGTPPSAENVNRNTGPIPALDPDPKISALAPDSKISAPTPKISAITPTNITPTAQLASGDATSKFQQHFAATAIDVSRVNMFGLAVKSVAQAPDPTVCTSGSTTVGSGSVTVGSASNTVGSGTPIPTSHDIAGVGEVLSGDVGTEFGKGVAGVAGETLGKRVGILVRDAT